MVTAEYFPKDKLAVVRLQDDVTAAEAFAANERLRALLPEKADGLTLLADFSEVGFMEPEVEAAVKATMALLASRGVKRVLRVLPEPAAAFGFDLMSRCFYGTGVATSTFRTAAEARAALRA